MGSNIYSHIRHNKFIYTFIYIYNFLVESQNNLVYQIIYNYILYERSIQSKSSQFLEWDVR